MINPNLIPCRRCGSYGMVLQNPSNGYYYNKCTNLSCRNWYVKSHFPNIEQAEANWNDKQLGLCPFCGKNMHITNLIKKRYVLAAENHTPTCPLKNFRLISTNPREIARQWNYRNNETETD